MNINVFKRIAFCLMALMTLGLPSTSSAYIPKFWMVLSRTAENHGRGVYRFEQDVVFTHKNEPLSVHETWFVENGQKMKVIVKGKGVLRNKVQMTFLYDGAYRYYVGANGARKKSRLSATWFEDFFHFRYSQKQKPRMHSLKMIPSHALSAPESPRSLKQINYTPQDFMRLARTGGKTAYAVGQPTPPNSALRPGLWIEQDQFNILKLRFPGNEMVKAGSYTGFSSRLKFPQRREVLWGENRVLLVTNSVKSYGQSRKVKKVFAQSSLDYGKNPGVAVRLPEDRIIQEFYSKFR